MAGYFNYSMSNNAVRAYEDGEKPLSRWSKRDIMAEIKRQVESGELTLCCDISRIKKIPLELMKEEFLYCSSRHHTSSHYNLTEFYSLDTSILGHLTESQIEKLEDMYLERKGAEKGKEEEKWKCSFLEWSGKGKHRKAKRMEGTGTVKGMWLILPDGRKKKTTATGFEFLTKL